MKMKERRFKRRAAAFFGFLFLTVHIAFVYGSTLVQAEEKPAVPEELQGLYAQSAVLMDADSGRILFSQNGQDAKAMASTTKIMTCILALEYGRLDDELVVSEYAARQPKVHLGVSPGEKFYLRDLLYSLMLESHNDSAVIIAEAVGGSVEGFADMMNAKAKELGCNDTYFITPNGLDASDEFGTHHTTAEELAKIMKYCIVDSQQKEMFLEITKTSSYQFQNVEKTRSFSCSNHNAFLGMMEGALSGKTGFTADAGYCYVGALKQGERSFIVALLACGWPNNKGYKWADTKKLMNYGLAHFEYKDVWQKTNPGSTLVENGVPDDGTLRGKSTVSLQLQTKETVFPVLLGDFEEVEIVAKIPDSLKAPVDEGEPVGKVQYRLNGDVIKDIPVITEKKVEKIDLKWDLIQIVDRYLLQTNKRLKNINTND